MEHFPRTDPAIIVIVKYRDACLLGRRPRLPPVASRRWPVSSNPANRLKTAYAVRCSRKPACVWRVRLSLSQPWPFPASIMLGFTAQAEDPRIEVGPELAEARWFDGRPDAGRPGARASWSCRRGCSVAYRLIEHWLRKASGVALDSVVNDEPFLPGRD